MKAEKIKTNFGGKLLSENYPNHFRENESTSNIKDKFAKNNKRAVHSSFLYLNSNFINNCYMKFLNENGKVVYNNCVIMKELFFTAQKS